MNLEESRNILNQLGYAPVIHIASGMEGHVFDIGNQLVAKVWFSKDRAELEQLQRFYQVVEGLNLPFATPLLSDIRVCAGTSVSIERFLPGTPMRDLVRGDEPEPPEFATEAIISVLSALKDRPVSSETNSLPILGVIPSPRNDYTRMLLEVAAVKVRRYGDQLRQSVPDFDRMYDHIVRFVGANQQTMLHAIHGDICPANILLGPDLKVSALIDWGFLSYFGDQLLETSIACGTYNMYGPSYRINDDYLIDRSVESLGYDRQSLLIYRALYAILTSNAYSEDGNDGHYEWCVGMLNRKDVRDALVRCSQSL